MLKKEILQLSNTLYNKRFCISDDLCRWDCEGIYCNWSLRCSWEYCRSV